MHAGRFGRVGAVDLDLLTQALSECRGVPVVVSSSEFRVESSETPHNLSFELRV